MGYYTSYELIDVVVRPQFRKLVAAALAAPEADARYPDELANLSMDSKGRLTGGRGPQKKCYHDYLATWLSQYCSRGIVTVWSQEGDGGNYAWRFDGKGGLADCSGWQAVAVGQKVKMQFMDLRIKPRFRAAVANTISGSGKKFPEIQSFLDHLAMDPDGLLHWSANPVGVWPELDAFVPWLEKRCSGGCLAFWSHDWKKKDWEYYFDDNDHPTDGHPWAYHFDGKGGSEIITAWDAFTRTHDTEIEFINVKVADDDDLSDLINAEKDSYSDRLRYLFSCLAVDSRHRISWTVDSVGRWGYHGMLVEYLTDRCFSGGMIKFRSTEGDGTSWAYQFDGDCSATICSAHKANALKKKLALAAKSKISKVKSTPAKKKPATRRNA